MNNTLAHHGILGQKWGIRRYQNKDGTWTDAGKERYGDNDSGNNTKEKKSGTGKKVAVGVAVGAATVAGVVLTAYLVKRIGSKNVSDLANTIETGKEAVETIMNESQISTTPAAKLTIEEAPKKAVEAVKNAASVSSNYAPSSSDYAPSSKLSYNIPNNYDYKTLMGQNDDLLKKMYADLLS